ncbi:hypothetical protein MY11210_003193 [Beauveria gryllotalpidicola]
MKLHAVLLASLASVGAASPAAESAESAAAKCKPATYRCERSHRAWDVCNSSGEWVFAGLCPPGTVCKFNKQNGSPYCLPRNMNEFEL